MGTTGMVVKTRETLHPAVLDHLAAWLRHNVGVSAGRTCAGGLTKFEPRELERLPIPKLERLHGRKNGERLRRAGSKSMPWSWTP